MNAAVTNRDAEAYLDVCGDDAVFVRHATGVEMDKPQFAEMTLKMMASETVMGARRCFFANDDILVHSVDNYPDATRGAVAMASTVKDGKVRAETGATPLPQYGWSGAGGRDGEDWRPHARDDR